MNHTFHRWKHLCSIRLKVAFQKLNFILNEELGHSYFLCKLPWSYSRGATTDEYTYVFKINKRKKKQNHSVRKLSWEEKCILESLFACLGHGCECGWLYLAMLWISEQSYKTDQQRGQNSGSNKQQCEQNEKAKITVYYEQRGRRVDKCIVPQCIYPVLH